MNRMMGWGEACTSSITGAGAARTRPSCWPRLQQAHVQRADAPHAQRRRHVALHDALGQAFDHRGLAHAGFAREGMGLFWRRASGCRPSAGSRRRGPSTEPATNSPNWSVSWSTRDALELAADPQQGLLQRRALERAHQQVAGTDFGGAIHHGRIGSMHARPPHRYGKTGR